MNRYKILTACLFILYISASYAQLGTSSVGVLSHLGVSVLGSHSLGNQRVATTASCSSQCSSVLAVTGLHLEASRQGPSEVVLNWYTLTENNSKGFFVQRSFTNSFSYRQTAFVLSKGNSNQKTGYVLSDTNTFQGITYYRITQQDNDGQITYSNTVSVDGISNNQFSIYPNPVSGGVCNLLLPTEYANTITTVRLYNAAGNIVYQRQYTVAANAIIPLNQLSGLPPAIYLVSVSNHKNSVQGKLTIL